MPKFIHKAQLSSILHFFKIWWMLFLIVYLLMYGFKFVALPNFQEWYFVKYYPLVRNAGAWLMSWLPIPTIHIYVIILFVWLLNIAFKLKKGRWLTSLFDLSKGLILIFTSFYVLWGFNYSVPSFVDRLGIEVQQPDSTWIVDAILSQGQKLSELRSQLPNVEESFAMDIHGINKELHHFIDSMNVKPITIPYIKHTLVEIKQLKFGQLLRLETSGVYLSQTFQGHVDAALSYIQKPFTIAHETLHGYGITSESDCNLMAYLALRDSDNPYFKYSAEMAFYRYLAFEIIDMDRVYYQDIRNSLNQSVQNDLDHINQCLRIYKPLLGPIKDKLYSTYLKGNGISDGLKNYSYFLKVLYTLDQKDTTQ